MFLLWFSFIELTITWYKSRVWGISCSYYTLHYILSRSRYMCHSWDVNVTTSRFSTFVFLWRFIAIIFFSRLHCFCALCYHTFSSVFDVPSHSHCVVSRKLYIHVDFTAVTWHVSWHLLCDAYIFFNRIHVTCHFIMSMLRFLSHISDSTYYYLNV